MEFFLSFSHLKKGATRQFAPPGSTHFARKRRYTFTVMRFAVGSIVRHYSNLVHRRYTPLDQTQFL